jgi:segregation and condensation protein B
MPTTEKREVLIKQVKEKTLELGPNPEAMAAKLRELGFKGTMGDPTSCVLGRYYADAFPDELVSVSGLTITIDGCDFRPFETAIDADTILPEHVFDFISLFDDGKFPDLVDPTYPHVDNGYEDDDDWDEDLDDEDEDEDEDEDDDEDWEEDEDDDEEDEEEGVV